MTEHLQLGEAFDQKEIDTNDVVDTMCHSLDPLMTYAAYSMLFQSWHLSSFI